MTKFNSVGTWSIFCRRQTLINWSRNIHLSGFAELCFIRYAYAWKRSWIGYLPHVEINGTSTKFWKFVKTVMSICWSPTSESDMALRPTSDRIGSSAKIVIQLCGGYNYDSTSIRRPFDCLSKVIKVTRYQQSRWSVSISRPQSGSPHTGRSAVVKF